MIENVIRFFKPNYKPDPVKLCFLYNTMGCSHVDGPLCHHPTCDMKANLEVTPRGIVERHDGEV